MNIDHLSIFVDLAETLNFRKTAYRKNISQPAVSQAINSIENEIGVKLFNRSRSGVTITSKGKVFYEDIKPLLNTYYKSVQEVQQIDNIKTFLTIGMTNSPFESIFIPKLIREFQNKYPNEKIFLQNYDHNQLKRQLVNGDCDLILTTQDDIADLKVAKYQELIKGRFCALVPKNNDLSQMNLIDPEDLKNQSLILLDNNWCPPEQLRLQEIIRKENYSKNISYVNNVDTANIMCKSALGITIGPSFVLGKENEFVNPIPLKYDVNLSYGSAFLNTNQKAQIKHFNDTFMNSIQ